MTTIFDTPHRFGRFVCDGPESLCCCSGDIGYVVLTCRNYSFFHPYFQQLNVVQMLYPH